jgi:hypothetical protein
MQTMNTPYKCLNCNQEVSGNFCNNCGQKSSIQRITFLHFIKHDFLHGLFHLDKGMLFTAKESLTRPGKAAIDYIEGKRIRYYNVFYFILILIGINIFFGNYYEELSEIYLGETSKKVNTVLNQKLDAFFKNYAKILIFSFVPMFAINSFILFRKRKFNFSEHIVIAGITFLGILLISTFSKLFLFFEFTENFDIIANITSSISAVCLFVFPIFSYYQTFKDYYKKIPFAFRILLFTVMIVMEMTVFLFITIGFLSEWVFGNGSKIDV